LIDVVPNYEKWDQYSAGFVAERIEKYGEVTIKMLNILKIGRTHSVGRLR
jgi:hypothetical protein